VPLQEPLTSLDPGAEVPGMLRLSANETRCCLSGLSHVIRSGAM